MPRQRKPQEAQDASCSKQGPAGERGINQSHDSGGMTACLVLTEKYLGASDRLPRPTLLRRKTARGDRRQHEPTTRLGVRTLHPARQHALSGRPCSMRAGRMLLIQQRVDGDTWLTPISPHASRPGARWHCRSCAHRCRRGGPQYPCRPRGACDRRRPSCRGAPCAEAGRNRRNSRTTPIVKRHPLQRGPLQNVDVPAILMRNREQGFGQP